MYYLMAFFRWVNRKDPSGKNVFSGGFLGLDNIGKHNDSRHESVTYTNDIYYIVHFSPLFLSLSPPSFFPSPFLSPPLGIFDRSKPLPTGGELEQADGTAWMAFFCVIMLDIALELALDNDVYDDMASKFFEHFVLIVDAMNKIGACEGQGLWDEKDGFYYDFLR